DQPGDRQQQPRIVTTFGAVFAHRLRGAESEHHRTFNVARPTSTSTTEMIQNRTITRGSGQPFNSKWWWIGAIRNTRLPRNLKLPTCSITDAVSTTNKPPITSRMISWRTITATQPIAAPIASAPTSPMNTCAGYVLNHRKPRPAPVNAPQNTLSS